MTWDKRSAVILLSFPLYWPNIVIISANYRCYHTWALKVDYQSHLILNSILAKYRYHTRAQSLNIIGTFQLHGLSIVIILANYFNHTWAYYFHDICQLLCIHGLRGWLLFALSSALKLLTLVMIRCTSRMTSWTGSTRRLNRTRCEWRWPTIRHKRCSSKLCQFRYKLSQLQDR